MKMIELSLTVGGIGVIKPRLIKSSVILVIVFALALAGAYGANFVGNDNGGSYSAAVSASSGGAVSMNSIGSANPHFAGTNAKLVGFSKKWMAGGNTFSEVGFLLRNTQFYDVTITGAANKALKKTNAELYLQATADYISAYGKSGTARKYEAGADMTVKTGSAEVIVRTDADGIGMTAEASIGTNLYGDDSIAGERIDTHAYYKDISSGEERARVDGGALSSYIIWARSAKSLFSGVEEEFGYAIGDHLLFTTDAKKTVSGTTMGISTSTEITDGYVTDYDAAVDDYGYLVADQMFYEAGTSASAQLMKLWKSQDPISIRNIYTESSKNLKMQEEQDAYITGPGTIIGLGGFIPGYSSSIGDPFVNSPYVNQLVFDAYAGNPGNNANVEFYGCYKQITGSLTRQMCSSTSVTDGELIGFTGESSDSLDWYPAEFGTTQYLDLAQGTDIRLDNKYVDNKKGYKEARVFATDPSLGLTGTIANSYGSASSDGTTQDVRVQGHTSGLDVTADAYKYYNQHATASYHAADPWFNYFLGYVDDPVAEVGHFTTGGTGDTIQDALNAAPGINGVNNNIFLGEPTTAIPSYSGPGNYNIVNNIAGGNNPVEKSFTLWGAGSYMRFAGNSVIDAENNGRIFDLTSSTASQTFNFKNIDFNNGKTADNGGAIFIEDPTALISTVNIENSNFNNNQAAYGGAIENDYQTLHITNSSFNNNHADTAGGAIRNGQGTVTIDNTRFNGNYANVGGAIAQGDKINLGGPRGGSATLTGCTFTSNHADHGYGGAIFNGYYGHATTAPTVNANGCTFTDNHAYGAGIGNGGAYAATYTQIGSNTAGTSNAITNSVFNGNSAEEQGNAIYTQGTASNSFNIGNNLLPQDIVIVP